MEVTELKNKIIDLVDPVFRGLGLSGPFEYSIASTDLHLAYMSDDVGLEIIIEMADFFVFAMIFHPKEKTVPIGYHDESGRRQKLYLQQALNKLSANGSSYNEQMSAFRVDSKNYKEFISLVINIIEQNWLAIVENKSCLFPDFYK